MSHKEGSTSPVTSVVTVRMFTRLVQGGNIGKFVWLMTMIAEAPDRQQVKDKIAKALFSNLVFAVLLDDLQ